MGLTFHPRFDCALCPTRCDGRSKSAYVFEDDVALSEAAEDWLAGHLADALGVDVYKAPAQRHGLPDLALIRGDRVLARVEVKAQGPPSWPCSACCPRPIYYPTRPWRST